VFLEVFLGSSHQLDGGKLVAMADQLVLFFVFESGILPTSLESGDDWADKSTLYDDENQSSYKPVLVLTYLNSIRLDGNEAIQSISFHRLSSVVAAKLTSAR
jgi:hypothetical protein